MSKKKAEPSAQEKVNQLAYEMRVREEQIKGLNDNIRLLTLQLDELNKTIETVNHVKVLEAGEDMLVPLGAGVYAKAKIADVSTFTLDLGAKILAERKPTAITKLLDDQKKKTEDARKVLEEQLNSTIQRAQVVQKELEGVLKQSQ